MIMCVNSVRLLQFLYCNDVFTVGWSSCCQHCHWHVICIVQVERHKRLERIQQKTQQLQELILQVKHQYVTVQGSVMYTWQVKWIVLIYTIQLWLLQLCAKIYGNLWTTSKVMAQIVWLTFLLSQCSSIRTIVWCFVIIGIVVVTSSY